jgi:hypothetical protein
MSLQAIQWQEAGLLSVSLDAPFSIFGILHYYTIIIILSQDEIQMKLAKIIFQAISSEFHIEHI